MKAPVNRYLPDASRIVCGCMGLGGGWDSSPVMAEHVDQAHQVIDAALDSGINQFDHADIYTFGKAEQVFGQVLLERPGLRERLILQSKCGIRFADGKTPKRFDFSRSWIIHSVENILKRLQTDYLDILLLHRPDPLMEPEEIAEAFSTLHRQGMVRCFGVSNMNQHQIAFLQSSLDQPLVANQLELSLSKLDWLNAGVEMNTGVPAGGLFSGGLLEHCRRHHIQLQAWGCLSKGLLTGRDISDQPESIKNTAHLVQEMASEMDSTPEALVLAWIMHHPATIQPVIGTTNPDRIRACADASRISLSREQWYRLYITARGSELP